MSSLKAIRHFVSALEAVETITGIVVDYEMEFLDFNLKPTANMDDCQRKYQSQLEKELQKLSDELEFAIQSGLDLEHGQKAVGWRNLIRDRVTNDLRPSQPLYKGHREHTEPYVTEHLTAIMRLMTELLSCEYKPLLDAYRMRLETDQKLDELMTDAELCKFVMWNNEALTKMTFRTHAGLNGNKGTLPGFPPPKKEEASVNRRGKTRFWSRNSVLEFYRIHPKAQVD